MRNVYLVKENNFGFGSNLCFYEGLTPSGEGSMGREVFQAAYVEGDAFVYANVVSGEEEFQVFDLERVKIGEDLFPEEQEILKKFYDENF